MPQFLQTKVSVEHNVNITVRLDCSHVTLQPESSQAQMNTPLV